MLQHAIASIRRNQTQSNAAICGHFLHVCLHHRTRMKCSDLIVIQICRNKCLRREFVGNRQQVLQFNTLLLQPFLVGREVVTHSGHRRALPTQHVEVVGNVPGTATEIAAHIRHKKRDIQHMYLVGQDVFLELPLEYHDGVIRHRTADQC